MCSMYHPFLVEHVVGHICTVFETAILKWQSLYVTIYTWLKYFGVCAPVKLHMYMYDQFLSNNVLVPVIAMYEGGLKSS